MSRKHIKDEVIKSLNTKNDCKIVNDNIYILTDTVWDPKKKEIIENPKKKHDLGNGSWGKIDFLVNYHFFNTIKVSDFNDIKKH